MYSPPIHGGASALRTRLICAWLACVACATAGPLRLLPENPRYAEFRGEPVMLVGSSEHYGALVNLDFHYERYLDETRACGLNMVRIFTGTYIENAGAFNISVNTLAPGPGRALTPWARSEVPGAADGGNKYDLTKWNPAWFQRLRAFVKAASERGIIVEVTLFCPFYNDTLWAVSPMNAANHINGAGAGARTQCFTLESDLLPYQIALARRCAEELAGCDNVFLEVMNEPYQGGVPNSWQDRIVTELADAMPDPSTRLMIAVNVANYQAQVTTVHPDVSILNFHYAYPEAALQNLGLNRLIGNDETGFAGETEYPYRKEGWRFLLAGGGLLNHLDFTFTAEREDGMAQPDSPGGGGPPIRRQLGILRWFMESLPFARCAPLSGVVTAGVPQGGGASVFGVPGETYALYLWGGNGGPLTLSLPAGTFRGRWIDPRSGDALATVNDIVLEAPGEAALTPPPFGEDIALLLVEDEHAQPSITLESPTYQSIIPVDSDLVLRAVVDAAGGTVQAVEYFRDGMSIGMAEEEPYELVVTPPVRGLHGYRAAVRLHDGRTAGTWVVKCQVTGAFRHGVNLNGPETVTPGQTWQADSSAAAAGMTLTQAVPHSAGASIPLYPKPDAPLQSLVTSQYLRAEAGGNPQLTVGYPVANGHYDVFVHIVEAVAEHSRDVTLFIEGTRAAVAIGDLALGEWVNYGPYRTEVKDGVLNLGFQRTTKGNPKVSSFSVYQADAPVDPAAAALELGTDGDTLVLDFPATVNPADVECSLTLDGDWQPAPFPHADHGEIRRMIVPTNEPRRFFRIRKVTE